MVLLVLHATVFAAAPVLDALVHDHTDRHAGELYLYAPGENCCPAPHPEDCQFCLVARAQLHSAAGAVAPPDSTVRSAVLVQLVADAPRPVFTGPLGARAPPSS
jgi:hypothetical protein